MATTTPAHAAGSRVRITGLQSKPELNGRIGTVLGPDFSEEAKEGYSKGRLPVRVDGLQGAPLLLKPSSLEAASDAPIDDTYERLCDEAWNCFEERHSSKAIEKFKKAIALDGQAWIAHFQLAQVYEADLDELPGAMELSARSFARAEEISAPETSHPDYNVWSASFVRAANLLTNLPSAQKPTWWTPSGLKQRCGLVLSNPQGLMPDAKLVSPAWTIMAFAFLLENNTDEAASCYEKAAGYELDGAKCQALLQRASELNGGRAV